MHWRWPAFSRHILWRIAFNNWCYITWLELNGNVYDGPEWCWDWNGAEADNPPCSTKWCGTDRINPPFIRELTCLEPKIDKVRIPCRSWAQGRSIHG